jgi:hypothetical protein
MKVSSGENFTTSFGDNIPPEMSIPSMAEQRRSFVGATGLGT